MLATPLALWVAAVLAVPGIDGCPMHGLHAPRPVSAAEMAHAAASAELMGHAHYAASTDDHAPANNSRPQCDCPGDCSAGVDVAMAPPAPVVAVTVALVRTAPQVPVLTAPPATRIASRQPPSIGPPLA